MINCNYLDKNVDYSYKHKQNLKYMLIKIYILNFKLIRKNVRNRHIKNINTHLEEN